MCTNMEDPISQWGNRVSGADESVEPKWVDGQEVSKKRFCDLNRFFDEDVGIEYTQHFFTFYHIFEPGELATGYHVFNIHYETTMSEYDPVTGEWIKLKDPWIGSALDFWHWNKDWWGVPLIDNLVIYVS